VNKEQQKYLKMLGSRILCELNDLKRNPAAASVELDIPEEQINSIINGLATEEQAYELINKMGQVYPIDHLQLHLLKDDTVNGAKFVTSVESMESRRVFDRKNKEGQLTPYYEYRDTAMSRLALFKPEWIEVLRNVDDSNPNNPDVVLNNGHFMHQVTLFVGPVNFYYEDTNGEIQCCEMNTGDSNYITPYMKHSFASRDKDELTYIVACTLGSGVYRSQRELYSLGQDTLNKLILNHKEPNKASRQLIRQFMDNAMVTVQSMQQLLNGEGMSTNIKDIFETDRDITIKEYRDIANVLDIEVSDICVPEYKGEECVIKRCLDNKPHNFYAQGRWLYNIHTLAQTSKMPFLRSSIVDVLAGDVDLELPIERSLHTYMINFGNSPVDLKWEYEGVIYDKTINPGDSAYLKPFVKFAFGNQKNTIGRMFLVGISTSLNFQSQKELSNLIEPNRVINDLEPWYDY